MKSLLPSRFVQQINSPSVRSRFFNAVVEGPESAGPCFRKIAQILTEKDPATGELYRYHTNPCRAEIAGNWQILAANAEQDGLRNALNRLLDRDIDPNTHCGLREQLELLLEGDPEDGLIQALTCLTLISCTILYWNPQWDHGEPEYEDTARKLETLVLPGNRSGGPSKSDLRLLALTEANEKEAVRYLENIRGSRHGAGIDSHYRQCVRILDMWPRVSAQLRGEAAFYLYQHSNAGNILLPKGDTPVKYLEIAHSCGYPEAEAAWKKQQHFALKHIPRRAAEDTQGLCLMNAENTQSVLFRQTVPGGWDICALDETWAEETRLWKYRNRKFLLFHDDPRKNLKDTLSILHEIKQRDISMERYPVEIYLRGSYETYAPLIDTAISHMNGKIIPVHILDAERDAAQQLLGKHPLFYPIRGITGRKNAHPDGADVVSLHFVVLGDSDCAMWLVREAFWLMTFLNSRILPRITILGPEAEGLKRRINGLCPGMIQDDDRREDMSFPRIESRNIAFDSPEFFSTLEKLSPDSAGYFYFAVAAGTEEQNLSLAIRLREWLIREQVHSPKFLREKQMPELPVIAFHCPDPDIALLSRSMVAQMENYGNQWFNNYGLIPFGELSQRYSWDGLDGGHLEQIALRVHKQYCGILYQETEDTLLEARRSYCIRQYNRDSSFAVAMSIPYRLFQWDASIRLIPANWSILDPDGLIHPSVLDGIGKRLEAWIAPELRDPNHPEVRNAIANVTRWEKERWNRYMMARGWLSATTTETVAYMEAGNPRQQLYIARLHPCIRPYDDLEQLEKALEKKLNMKKNFRDADLQNVLQTGLLISDIQQSRQLSQEAEK